MQTSKGLIFLAITIFILNVLYGSAPLSAQTAASEQQIIEDILALDAKILALKNEVEKLSNKNSELERELKEKKNELALLNSNFSTQQKKLAKWVVFSFKGGTGNMLAVLLGAEDLSDFFRRYDNVMFFMEYYKGIIDETKNLISLREKEEGDILRRQQEIQNLEKQLKLTLDGITQTLKEKQKQLAEARAVLKDTTFLEDLSKNWQESLPSLDYLLKNLSALPWYNLDPDSLKIDYTSSAVKADFSDATVTNILLSQDENLKNIFFKFHKGGVTVSEKNADGSAPLYSITCDIQITENQKIKFIPKELEFRGVTLSAKVIDELTVDYDLSFVPPPLPYNLKIYSVSTEEGKLILEFRR